MYNQSFTEPLCPPNGAVPPMEFRRTSLRALPVLRFDETEELVKCKNLGVKAFFNQVPVFGLREWSGEWASEGAVVAVIADGCPSGR